MINASKRFHGHGSLKYVYRNSYVARSHMMTVRSVINRRRAEPRFAVVVSKKVHKSAVGRNRIRRRLYEIVRRDIPPLPYVYDTVVIVTSSEVLAADHTELVNTMRSLFDQIRTTADQ